MQDMISKIVKIDEEARKITEEVESNISKQEEEIAQYRQKIQTEYLDRARLRIEKNRVNEQKHSDKLLEEIKNSHETALNALKEKSKENFNDWVDNIFRRVISKG